MQIESENDFYELRQYMQQYYKKFPMFRHDVVKIENAVEEHIKQYSIAMVHYRQSHKKHFLEHAQEHIKSINRIIATTEKMELIALLSQG